jgi:hypothetical protein
MSIPCLIERFAGLVALRAAREEILGGSWKFPKAAGEVSACDMTAIVKGFGCRPYEGRHREFGGRRPKAAKGGNRAGGT